MDKYTKNRNLMFCLLILIYMGGMSMTFYIMTNFSIAGWVGLFGIGLLFVGTAMFGDKTMMPLE